MKNLKDSYIYRFLKTAFGLFLCGTGGYFTMQANVGLAPWDSLNVGFSNMTGLIYGDVSIIIGIVIIAIDLLVLHEKIGFGTLMNTVMYAKWVDLWNYVELLPKQQDMLHGLPMLFFGMVVMSFGMWIYMSGGMGCGLLCGAIAGAMAALGQAAVDERAHVTEDFKALCADTAAKMEKALGGVNGEGIKPALCGEGRRCAETVRRAADVLEAQLDALAPRKA